MTGAPRRRTLGSRYLYEPFDSAHARIETHERVFEERWVALNRTLEQIESGLDRLERRLWLAVYGAAIALAGQILAFSLNARLYP
ncbi:GTA head formation protein, RCAP_rcc01685 family [Pikeienuella sp. HZG-20]|uniref:GTA head formation protein, RCAP_rcc01685 family n=1 Tax=Paludibacillus litoralis TaxID=3133267 RepID=UPI0030EC69F7